jgi:hypothetical protein
MAIVIDLADRRSGGTRREPANGGSAQILLFTGVRFERLEFANLGNEEPQTQSPEDQALRNRTG